MVNVIIQNPEVYDVIERAVRFEEENVGSTGYLGFEWYDVQASPQLLNSLVTKGVLKINYKSNKSTHYMFVDREAVKRALESAKQLVSGQEEVVEKVPEDLFSVIELHEDKKEILMKGIMSEKPVHFLLVGSVASAKSLFLMELSRLPRAEYVLGSSLSKAGIIDLMFEKHPRYLIIDEIDKVDGQENLTALLSLMETGVLVETKWRRHNRETFKTWVFAGANYYYRIREELRSRFFKLTFNEYTEDEFLEVAINVLIKREKVDYVLAEYIANKLLREVNTRDVRDAVRVARLSKTMNDVDRIIEIMKKNVVKGVT